MSNAVNVSQRLMALLSIRQYASDAMTRVIR